MSKQPEALRLAAHAEANSNFGDMKLIAAKLRRLHEVNQELVESLKECVHFVAYDPKNVIGKKARAVIAKAEGEQK